MYVGTGAELLIVDDEQPKQTISWPTCPIPSGVCLDAAIAEGVRNWGRLNCQARSMRQVKGLGAICPNLPPKVTRDQMVFLLQNFNACSIANIPTCGPPQAPAMPRVDLPGQPTFEPTIEPDEELEEPEDNNKYIVGGILGLLIVGGVVYAATRKKKKNKRK